MKKILDQILDGGFTVISIHLYPSYKDPSLAMWPFRFPCHRLVRCNTVLWSLLTVPLCRTEQQKESAKLCRTWLGAQDTQKTKDEYENNRGKRFEGTCEWLLKEAAFQNFIKEDEKRHLWVYGHPGQPRL